MEQIVPPSSPPPLQPQTSTRSVVSLVLGILSLTCCGFFTGIPAFFLAKSEIKGIDEGRMSVAKRPLAKIGMILGSIGTSLSLLVTIIYVVLMALGISAGMMGGGFPKVL